MKTDKQGIATTYIVMTVVSAKYLPLDVSPEVQVSDYVVSYDCQRTEVAAKGGRDTTMYEYVRRLLDVVSCS